MMSESEIAREQASPQGKTVELFLHLAAGYHAGHYGEAQHQNGYIRGQEEAD